MKAVLKWGPIALLGLAICVKCTCVHIVAQTPVVPTEIFARENLVAWCIVPFDAARRGPKERAEMLRRLGIRRLAYDYRAEHVPTFTQEIQALRAAEIELFAWWFPTELNEEARSILKLLKQEGVHTQLWVSGFAQPAEDSPQALQSHLETESARIASIADAAAEIGCTVGLYNHGGWFGQIDNQLAVLQKLQRPNLGIVYNLHHAHADLERLPEVLHKIAPYLLCLNLNGMSPGADAKGQKIMPIGAGEWDAAIVGAIEQAGYRGPLGILNHTDLDAEQRLRDNLAGLDWLVARRSGLDAAPPQFTTWPAVAPQQPPPSTWLSDDQVLIRDLWERAQRLGNAERGLTVFTSLRSSCFSCHRIGEHGGRVGPSLSEVVPHRTPEALIESLFWPNRRVEPEYQPTIVTTVDGATYRGYLRNEDDSQLVLFDPANQTETSIAKDAVDEQRPGQSLMPDELMSALSPQQQLDLVRLLLELRTPGGLDMAVVDTVLSHAVAYRPETFPYTREPLQPEHWPSWEHPVNRGRVYDFYAKQAEHFRRRPHGPLLAPFPGLDGGDGGHWGNQDETTWRGHLWNQSQLGSVQCGVFHGEGIVVPRGVCVRLGEQGEFATCFNPDTLAYEVVWRGFVKFSEVRQGFMDGAIQDGPTIARPASPPPAGPFEYLGFYRHGSQVLFAYRLNGEEFLDMPQFVDGAFRRIAEPRATHPWKHLAAGGPSQWPQSIETPIRYGQTSPYAIDTIEMPTENPWRVPLFAGDHDFRADGSALLATMTGDVWQVENFAADPAQPKSAWQQTARWRRFAAGLHQPLGLIVDDDGVFVMGRDQLTRLHDLNGDGEADYYECYSNQHQTSSAGHDFICGLQRDAQGNFYTASGNQGLVRISADGRNADVLATGFRNPDGVGLYPDGVVTVPCSEGEWTPASMICAVRVPKPLEPIDRVATDQLPFFGYRGPRAGQLPQLPMVYLPRGLDNSSGGQVFVESDRWGPLRDQLIHFSYGLNSHFLILRDEVGGQLQGAVVPLSGEFRSGSHRGRFHPTDGQLYVSGMAGWGQYSTDIGCFQRVRYTGQPLQIPVGIHIHENGVAVRFAQPLDPELAADPQQHFAQAWNYRYSGAYGSPEFSTGHHGVVGHDALQIAGAHVLDDGLTLFLELPELQPVNQLHLRMNVDRGRGHDLFVTVHRLDVPRTDLPEYRPLEKRTARHPLEFDVALATERKPNRWAQPLEGARPIQLAAGPNLTYTETRLHVRPGETVALTFDNPDVVPHNWVLLRPGALEPVGQLANRLVADPSGFLNHYVPESDDVLFHTDIVEPGKQATIYFRAPAAPGRYPYLCTFPGHWMVMNGEMIVE